MRKVLRSSMTLSLVIYVDIYLLDGNATLVKALNILKVVPAAE